MKPTAPGYVLLSVSVVLLMVATATVALFAESGPSLTALRSQHEQAQLRALLDAGLARNLRNLRANPTCNSYAALDGTLVAGSYTTSLSATSSSPVTLTVAATHTAGMQQAVERSVNMYSGSNQIDLPAATNAFIEEDSPDHNHSDDNKLVSVATNDGGDHASLLRFDLAGLPRTALIESAELRMFLHKNDGNSADPDNVHRLTVEWDHDLVSWDRARSGLFGLWWTDGGDYEQQPFAQFANSAVGYHLLDLTRLTRLWHGGVNNYGVLLRSDYQPGSAEREYRSRTHSDANERPVLSVRYRCDCAIGCV